MSPDSVKKSQNKKLRRQRPQALTSKVRQISLLPQLKPELDSTNKDSLNKQSKLHKLLKNTLKEKLDLIIKFQDGPSMLVSKQNGKEFMNSKMRSTITGSLSTSSINKLVELWIKLNWT
jgi:hypothetical protein